jgi:regulation of enolase protein 1 (concanavalin A-like superfamily)
MARGIAGSAVLLGALFGLAGCSSAGAPSDVNGSTRPDGGGAAGSCVTPASGCPCSTEGATADCGQVTRVSGNYVTCSEGQTTCTNGSWGACIGDRITTKSIGSSAVSLQGLGSPIACMDDPCDPSCNEYVDTPTGLVLPPDSGLIVTEAGLTPSPIIENEAGIQCTGLVVNPPVTNVTVTSLSPLTTSPPLIDLTASYTPANCYSGLAPAAWSVDKTDLAAISGGTITLVSAVAGPLTATAYSGGFEATGVVNVTTDVVDSSGAPPGTAGQFNGPGTVPDDIQILYPYAATVFPRSIAAPVVQWNNNGVAATAVEVTIRYPATGTATYSVSLILPESNPPQAALGQLAWGYLDQTAAGQDALISIQRLVGGTLREPVTETIHFATTALRGNIYYTEYDVNAWTGTVKNLLPFGTAPASVAFNNGGCPVCHTVSAQGNMLITSNWGAADDTVARVNADATLTPVAYMWNNPTGSDSRGFAYSAITPDGLYGLQGSNWWGNTYDSNVFSQTSRPHNNGWGLLGSYYANTTFSGTPAFTEVDGTVDFTWGAGAPGTKAGIAAGSTYSVEWTGFVQPIFTETYTFGVESSDGALLMVNGQTVINDLVAQADTTVTGTIALTAGVKYPIALQYLNVSKTSQVHLRWQSAHQPFGVIPETQLYPSLLPTVPPCTPGQYEGCYADSGNRDLPTLLGLNPVTVPTCEAACGAAGFTYAGLQDSNQCFCGDSYGSYGTATNCNMACNGNGSEICGGGWANSVYTAACPPTPTSGLLATYYANQDFTGTTFTRIDPGVNFNWGGASPAPGIGGNNWSAEWTGQVTVPCTDDYYWCVAGDDGVRLWIDGVLVDDGWVDQGPTWYCNSVTGNAIAETAGKHDIKMDYYQDTGGSVAELFWDSACAGWQEIPAADLSPSGDQGTGGYDLPFHNSGDRGTGVPYSILQLSPVVNTSPVDVSALLPNTWGLGPTAMMAPTFSPDGSKLVFVDGDTSAGASWRQGLSFFDFNEGARQFSNRTNFVNTVPTNNIVRWPAVEPDSQSVIYQTNPTSGDDQQYGGMLPSGYSSIEGELWTVDMLNPVSHPPVPLTRLNAGLGAYDANLSYQPSVLPVSSGGYRWTVFTSDRQYGNTQNTVPGDNTDQLWVGALDDTVSAGTDRSHPPFWLPNQVLGDNGGRIRNERGYWVLDACKPSLANLNPPTPPTVPPFTWKDQDIGSVGFPGSATETSNVFTVVGGGDDIWNANDAFHYVYMPVSGDFVFQARVTYLAYADYWSKAGVMLRDNLGSGAAEEFTMVTAAALTGVEWRQTGGGGTSWTEGPGATFPYWVQLARVGNVVTGSVSPDGVTWTQVDQETPSIGSSAYIGLAVTAHNNGTTTTAKFDNVGFLATTPPDPRPGSLCQDNQDCCGALTNPPTAACVVDVPVVNPVTRHCLLLTANSCVPLGGTCSSDSDCCGFPNDHCTKGICASPPPSNDYTNVVYTRDYVGACPTGTEVVWRFFDWETITPSDSDIRFLAGTAATQAGLPTSDTAAGVVYLGTASGPPITTWTGADVGAALVAAKEYPSYNYLRIFVDFQPSSDHTQSATLTDWRQQFDCVASE